MMRGKEIFMKLHIKESKQADATAKIIGRNYYEGTWIEVQSSLFDNSYYIRTFEKLLNDKYSVQSGGHFDDVLVYVGEDHMTENEIQKAEREINKAIEKFNAKFLA